MRNSHGFIISSRWGGMGIPLIGAFSLLIGANQASVQVATNAYDIAGDSRMAAEQVGETKPLKIVKKAFAKLLKSCHMCIRQPSIPRTVMSDSHI